MLGDRILVQADVTSILYEINVLDLPYMLFNFWQISNTAFWEHWSLSGKCCNIKALPDDEDNSNHKLVWQA